MNNIQDLNIKSEVLPIFDYSLNNFTKNKILKILETPLMDEDQIIERQNILKAFALNMEVLKSYSYPVLYLNEVHFFLNNFKVEDSEKRKYSIFSNRSIDKILIQNKIHQIILFFYRLESVCFSRLRLVNFPEIYVRDINRILVFLSFFELSKYEKLIREKNMRDKHMKEITIKISKLKSENKIDVFWEDFFCLKLIYQLI